VTSLQKSQNNVNKVNMNYKKAMNIPIILTSLTLLSCNVSNETEDTPNQSISQKSKLVSVLCLSLVDGDSKIDTLIKQQIQQIHHIPSKPKNWVELGNTWIKKSKLTHDPGFYLHAQECADYALKRDNQYIPAKELQVQVFLNNHQFSEARDLAQSIVTNSPKNRLGWALLSDAQLELGHIEHVQDSIKKLESLHAGMAFFTRASYLHWLQGDIKAANDALLAALQRRDMNNPYSAAWSFVQGADISWHRNDLVGAKALYNESLKWLPNFPLALIGLARVSIAQNNPQAAIELIHKIETTKRDAKAMWLLADAHEMAGNQIAYLKNQDKMIAFARTNDPLLLATFLSTKNRDHSLALKLILKEKESRGGIYIEDAYAWILYRLGRFEEAQVAIEKALSWGTQDAKLFYHAGAIKIASGDIKAGIALVHKALSLQPSFDFTGSQEAIQLIQQYGDSKHV
jgi:tetratricopeptide (TPR) repeat protein